MKIYRIILLITIALTLLSSVAVLAASYYANIQVQETDGNSYTYLPIISSVNNTYLAANGYIGAQGLDTRVTSGGTELPHMLTDNATLFIAPSVSSHGTGNYRYTTGSNNLTSFPIITGYGGYFAVADNVAIRPGGNYTISLTPYIDFTKIGQNIFNKGTISCNTTGADNITVVVNILQETNTASAVVLDPTDYARAGQFVTALPSGKYKVAWYFVKAGSPTGTAYFRLRRASDDSIIGTFGSFNVATTSTGTWVEPTDYVTNPTTQDAYFTYEFAGGDGSNNIQVRRNSTDTIIGETYRFDTSWALLSASYDYMMKIYPFLTAFGLSNGHQNINVSANSTKWSLSVGGIEKDSNSGQISIPASSSVYTFGSTATPSLSSVNITIGGNLKAQYQPNTIILGTNIPDRTGNSYNGTITWGTNPAGIGITIGSLISTSQPGLSAIGDEDNPGVIPSAHVPAGGEVDTTRLKDNPLYPIVSTISEWADLTEEQIWFIGATIIILIGMGIALVKVSNHMLLAGGIGFVLSGFFTAMGIYQWWMLLIFGFVFVMSILMERKPVV